jgi:hypothetical protein
MFTTCFETVFGVILGAAVGLCVLGPVVIAIKFGLGYFEFVLRGSVSAPEKQPK